MEFEGPEKKVELHVQPGFGSLRDLGRPFWTEVVAASQAQILSSIANDACDAYLLSESSLFVYPERAIMITCGQTTLVHGIRKILERVPVEQIDFLSYELKNEHFPDQQHTSFDEDARALSELMPSGMMNFGNPGGHHVNLFYLDREYEPSAEDTTLEILMHGLSEQSAQLFSQGPAKITTADLREQSGIAALLDGFTIDDHQFSPYGYSLNALKGPWYATIHVTPQNPGAYASFETNYPCAGEACLATANHFVQQAAKIFQPEACNVMFFHSDLIFEPQDFGYKLDRDMHLYLKCGYNVQFFDFRSSGKE